MKMTSESLRLVFEKAKPFLVVVFLQAGLAGMDIISKAALNEGMSNFVFVVYRHSIATLIIAPFAFILENIPQDNQAKNDDLYISQDHTNESFGAVTLRTYPAELSLTAWICLLATTEGAAVALVVEKGKASAWSIKWDTAFLATLYSGILCSAVAYYLQGVVMKERDPVFVTAFSPLSMAIVAIMSMSTFILAEKLFLGRVVGVGVIVIGLYFVGWGKQKDYKTSSMEEKLEEIW